MSAPHVDAEEATMVSSPSFVGAATSATSWPDEPDPAKLHTETDVTSVFDGIAPAKSKWVDLISTLLKDDGSISDIISSSQIIELCAALITVLQTERSLLQLEVRPGSSMAVVGDVHGQFPDLLHHILPQQAPNRSFLFLGDYVDRGAQSVECIVLLMALKVEFPNHVYLLRGNHEEAQTSRIYGFYAETATKYGAEAANEVWSRVNEAFCHLPVAATIVATDGAANKKYFCAHGGLSPELTKLNLISSIDRVDYGSNTLDVAATHIIDGLLWSDPVPEGSALRYRPNERGCGCAFGPRATEEFCAENGVSLVIRAHQMAMEGYFWNHNNLCLTVFSAPNYCGLSNNLGAVLLLDDKLGMQFVQYKSAPSKNQTAPPAAAGRGNLPLFFF